jgi:hypothetical protein
VLREYWAGRSLLRLDAADGSRDQLPLLHRHPACPNVSPPVPAVVIGPGCTQPTVLYFSSDQPVTSPSRYKESPGQPGTRLAPPGMARGI